MINLKNELLFGAIGVLMLAIVGLGGIALFTRPSTGTSSLGPTASSLQTSGTSARAAQVRYDGNDGEPDDDGDDFAINTPSATPAAPAQTSAQSGQSYTMAQVAAHNSTSSCWTAVNGSVYDLTSFIFQHPGGPGAIESLCGVDGSSAFNAQHGGQTRPANELASLYIGTLAK